MGWTWPNASELVQRLSGLSLVRVTLQSERVPVDPLLIFDNGWILEVFGDHYLDPWTLNLPNAVLVGDGQLAARPEPEAPGCESIIGTIGGYWLWLRQKPHSFR